MSADLARAACEAAAFTSGIACTPRGLYPPCIHPSGALFHKAGGRKNYGECSSRPTDADWPFVFEPHAVRTEDTRTVRDVVRLLKGRRVTIIGASDTAHLMEAINCALAATGLLQSHGCRFRHWGWESLTNDNCACVWSSSSNPNATRPCSALAVEGYSFETMLANSDVVVVAYNSQHFRQRKHLWQSDHEQVAARLHEWARAPGKVALLREPAAQHFFHGDYKAAGDERQIDRCLPYDPRNEPHDWNREAGIRLERIIAALPSPPRVALMPYWNASVSRYNMHGSSNCNASLPPNAIGQAGHCGRGADCLHWCYTPQHYDHAFFTPLYGGIAAADRRHRLASHEHPEHERRARVAPAPNSSDSVCDAAEAHPQARSPPCWKINGLSVFFETKRLRAAWANVEK
jgi:hypothetical protein